MATPRCPIRFPLGLPQAPQAVTQGEIKARSETHQRKMDDVSIDLEAAQALHKVRAHLCRYDASDGCFKAVVISLRKTVVI